MEAESQSEDSSSSPYHYLNNFITILRSASQNPLLLNTLIQSLSTQYPQILASFDSKNLQKDETSQIILQNLSKFSSQDAKKTPQLEKIASNDEETSAGSHCGEHETLPDEAKLETLKKNNKKLLKFEEVLDKIFTKLCLENADEIRIICLDVLKLIIPVLTDHFKNKPFEAVSAAVVVFSCRNANYPITLKEIVAAASEQGKDLTKMVNKCIFSLKAVLPEKEFSMKILNPEEMAKKILHKLKLDEKMLACVIEVIKVIEAKTFIKGKHPNTVAACAIKIASLLPGDERNGLSFESLADAANLNKITLKNSYRDLHLHSNEILVEMRKVVEVNIKELPNL
jgi:transcription initiation factor TFIIIB Brf1 subunit/transcription initiation factor TFIIB